MGLVVSTLAQNQGITLPEKPKRAKYVDYSIKQTGWWCAAQLGGGFSTTTNRFFGQFDFVNGYRFSEFLKVGIGVSPRIGLNTIPIYAQARGNFISQEDTMFAFFWNADLGYAINGGVYASPSVGLKCGDIRHNFLVSIYYALEGQRPEVSNQSLHLVGLRIGYEF
jgi:hypothetical protein